MDWISLIQTVITAITSVIIALIGAGYFKKMQDKKDEKKSREKLVEQIQKDEVIHFTLREIRRRFNSKECTCNCYTCYYQYQRSKLPLIFYKIIREGEREWSGRRTR